jgi:hypothetical protein
MNKIFSPNFITILTVLFLCFAPQNIFAAELNFIVVPNRTGDNKTTIVEVRIDPQSKKINVVEGAINFSGSATENLSVQIENGNSVLPLWPTPPQYVSDEKTIRFVGGVPNGFNNEGLLFIMRLSPSVIGGLKISYADGSAYLSDGKGTRENVFSKPLQINLNESGNTDQNNRNIFINKYAILIFAVVMFAFFLFYGYKKITKK